MKFIADTCVWSLLLRRRRSTKSTALQLLKDSLINDQVVLLGIVHQELLTGITNKEQYDKLLDALSGLNDVLATRDDHIMAASLANHCRSRGIQGTSIDFLICAQAISLDVPILTTDKDFRYYSKEIPIDLVKR